MMTEMGLGLNSWVTTGHTDVVSFEWILDSIMIGLEEHDIQKVVSRSRTFQKVHCDSAAPLVRQIRALCTVSSSLSFSMFSPIDFKIPCYFNDSSPAT
jgi:hypothetical protein